MFFKRIEIVGFKSFATKTVCDFIPGTTVIVGPNGCGKSNILDAVKWVLGEQAASQMRGKKMQDVIFAGSSSFKPLGVAQVTLTIDNAKRILPMEFDEIQVTRRLFRSGESEYQINKTPCRLRDVHELFLGTGIGKSAYSILEQGRVDQVVSAKPQERRFLIEEAAGISKFKIRKLEAQRKLERTDVDLSRLNDLVAEVERQVGTLKRQASKAERYKQIFDASRVAEQQLLVLRSATLRSRLAETRAELETVGDRLAKLRAELATHSAAEEEARGREDEVSARLSDENQGIYDLKTNLADSDNQAGRLGDQIATHQARVEQIEGELREMKAREDELGLRLEEAEQKLTDGEAARAHHEERFNALQRQYSELEGTVRERTRRIEQLQTEAGRLRETVARAENEIRMAEALIAGSEQDRREAGAVIAQLEERQLENEIRLEELNAKAVEGAAALEQAQTALAAERQAQRERQEALGTRLKELQAIGARIHQARARLETLNELKASYEGYYQGVREVMLASDAGRLKGILGVTANLVRAKKEHELAIEVALATHLQDVVARTAEDAREAIFYLKESGRGRATFLPLDRLQSTPLHHSLRQVLGRPGVLGVASELVDFDRSIQTAVDFMLGQTIVVRDLDVGLELGRQGFRARYVSLDGQLINPGGSMTGGRIQATGLMMREREIRDLAAEVERLTNDKAEGEKTAERLQLELTTGHHRIEAAQSDFDQRRLDQNSLTKDVEAAERAVRDARRALEERQAQADKIDQAVAGRRESIAQWQVRLTECSAKLAEAEAQLSAERDSARTQGDDIMSLGTEVAEARAEMNQARQRITDARAQGEAVRRDLEAVARQQEARRREAESLREQDVRLRQQIERIMGETAVLREQIAVMSERIGADQAAREELLAIIKHHGQQVEVLSRDVTQLDNRFREQELRATEFHASLGGLAEQCLEKFQCELDALAEAVGEVDRDPHALQAEVAEMRDKLERMGAVNMAALDEYQEQAKRLDFLKEQHRDLGEAKKQLEDTIARLDETTRKLFHQTFEQVRENFVSMFRRLFNGGKADLILEAAEGQDPLIDGGVEILAQPPGKKLQSITLMSGGEKAMTAVALLFALFLYKPSPFCILDEIDAPLDDVNVERFKAMVREFTGQTQFVVITHNKLTMELADAIYGVTMEESGVSKLVSVRFEQAADLVDAV